jgi:adenylylsulfate kinase-like enzyme
MDNLIGLQDSYEEPINPEVIANTEQKSPVYLKWFCKIVNII